MRHPSLLSSPLLIAVVVLFTACLGGNDDDGGNGGFVDTGNGDTGGRDVSRDLTTTPDTTVSPDTSPDTTVDTTPDASPDAPIDTPTEDPQFCVPFSTRACTCTEGGSGTQACNSAGTAYETCFCQPTECTSSTFSVSGSLVTSLATIDFTGAQATVSSVHKLDIDEQEDGCLASVAINLQLNELGCTLSLEYGALNGTNGGLFEAEFDADSFCPGFPDAQEGFYTLPYGFRPQWFTGLTEIADRLAESTCVDTSIGFPAATLTLEDSEDRTLTINLSSLSLSGTLYSVGDTEESCVEVGSCGTGFHDGGGGLCVGEGACEPGYVLLLDESCADEDTLPGPSECGAIDLGSNLGTVVTGGTMPSGAGSEEGSCLESSGSEVLHFWTAPEEGLSPYYYVRVDATGFTPFLHIRNATCQGVEYDCYENAAGSSAAYAYPYVQPGETIVIIVESKTTLPSGVYTYDLQVTEQ